MGDFFSILLSAIIVAGLVFSLVALVLTRAAAARAAEPLRIADTPVTILKPLCGAEPALAANLQALLEHGHAAPVQIIFGVSDARDPALLAVEAARRTHPDADIMVVVDNMRHGASAKMSNVINMARHIRHPLIVLADSDVAAPAGTIGSLCAALADPSVGVVSCLHAGRGDAGLWSRLAAMDISYRYMPSVLVGHGLGLAHPVLGPMMALRSETLASIGGFSPFADVLADDYEIGRAVRRLGLSLTIAPRFVIHGCSEAGAMALVRHELRWSRTIYGIDPAGFAGSLVTHVLANAMILVALVGVSGWTMTLLVAALLVRCTLKLAIDRASGTSSGPMILLPVRDLMSLLLFLATFFVGTVDWRGSRFKLTSDGRLLPERQI